MSFSLYRCGDDTYVVVAETMSPPIEAVRAYGTLIFTRAYPCHLMESPAWDRVSARIDERLYAIIAIEEMEGMFEMG